MSKLHTPFRYDYVGSFLRPERLKKARADYESGKINKAELTAVEDDCIRELVAKVKELGYQVITDGEFRRSHGILISCGASMALSIERQLMVIQHLTQKQQ